MATVNQRVESIQYDGTNSAAVLAFLSDVTFHSESGGVLEFEENLAGATVQLPVGGWVLRSFRSGGIRVMTWHGTDTDYHILWIEA